MPIVGITTDLTRASGRPVASAGLAYAEAVTRAGGTAVLLPPLPEEASRHLELCEALVLTGGGDARLEAFGAATHPKASLMDPQRQEYELRLLALVDSRPDLPVLGVCLGMQLMSLHAGGMLDQHLPETLATHGAHWDCTHAIAPEAGSPLLTAGPVHSRHRQAVADPGGLRVLARSEDGLIEAVADPARLFYLGVQWHPERTEHEPLGLRLFRLLVEAGAKRPR